MKNTISAIDNLSIATLRSLAIDAINKANSGHPGMALGSAPIVYTLFTRHLIANPENPTWINRDRFVLSAGHASALLYSLLHLAGYEVSLDDLKNFRQLGSLTPGHPEFGHTKGVDATTGPLGQGIAQAVGMALSEQAMQGQYEDGKDVINHYTYALCGDGCLQEGISQEAISFAGHQKLNKLILFYDANQVTLDGALDLSFSEDVKNRFISSHWDVLEVEDGNDVEAIDKAIIQAKKSKEKPTLIIVHTIIGYGSSKQGTSKVHGNPLGYEDGARTKKEIYGFDHEDFYVGEEVYKHFQETFASRGKTANAKWDEDFNKYLSSHKKDGTRLSKLLTLSVNEYLPDVYPDFVEGSKESTRGASGKALNDYILSIPNLMGGSADVAGSVMTKLNGGTDFTHDNRSGRNVNWGIREFAMAAMQNGMLLHGGVRTYVGCFLVFSDYMKSAIRTSALSKLPAIYLFSHDSVAVGEDGPTHQPIEHLAMLRSIPNLTVIRPCDERETYGAWHNALASIDHPTALILSRQALPLIPTSDAAKVELGAYEVTNETDPTHIIIATGSEVSLALDVKKALDDENVRIKVVSMPSWENFERQDDAYKASVLSLPREKCISIEMLSTFGWAKYAKYNVGIDTYGASAPQKDAIKHFGFDAASMTETIKAFVK